MANPFYDSMMRNGGMMYGYPQMPQMQLQQPPQNPYQMMSSIMQAMRNPAMFVKQNMPDIPDSIMNDPNQVLQYIQQTRGMTMAQIQQMLRSKFPGLI